jgi:hypothetical protein
MKCRADAERMDLCHDFLLECTSDTV